MRRQRIIKKLLFKRASAFLAVFTAFVTNLERIERNANREQVIKLRRFCKLPRTNF